MRLGRDLLFEVMKERGIRYLFGNPGTTELPIIDGCTVHPEVEYVMALHEHIAIGMAMGYARATGKPGVANVHVVPGLAHGLGNLYNAWRSRIPLVVTVGQLPTRLVVQEPILSGDLVRMARPFTKWAYEVHHVDEWPLVLHRAFKEAMAPPQGPVLLSLPSDVMLKPTDSRAPTVTPIGRRIRPDEGEVARAAQLLRQAERPLILVGDGVGSSGAWSEVAALAERLGAPVYTEALGSFCNFPNRHPHWAGSAPTDPAMMRALFDGVDVAVLCGFSSQAPFAYFDDGGPLIPASVKIVYIHDNPWEIGKNYPGVAGILGDVKLAVQDLLRCLEADGSNEKQAAKRRRELEDAFRRRAEAREARRRAADPSRLSAEAVAAELGAWLPPDGIVVNEAISNTRPFLEWIEFGDPLAFWGGKSGGLGHSMPAALGIKLGAPSRTVVNVVGDGTLLYYPQVFWTAASRKIPVIFLILNNRGYSILKLGLRSMGGPWGAPHTLPPGLDIAAPDVDFVGLARAFGVEGVAVRTRDELASALAQAREWPGPFVIEVALPPAS